MVTDDQFFSRRALLSSAVVVALIAVAGSLLWYAGSQPESPKSISDLVRENHTELFDDPHSPVDGNPHGDVTIVEFVDFNCGACRRMWPILSEVKKRDPALRIIYKDFPIRGPDSTLAARAALAAHSQGKYVEFHDALMTSRSQATQETIQEIAHTLRLDLPRLMADMEDAATTQQIERNLGLAKILGITGTPAFVIGKEVRSGLIDLPALESLIAQERMKTGSKPAPEGADDG